MVTVTVCCMSTFVNQYVQFAECTPVILCLRMQNCVRCEFFNCSYCLVYRLGGETLDVTVVQVSAGMYTISGTVHKSNLGGNKFTRILADYLAGEFRQ